MNGWMDPVAQSLLLTSSCQGTPVQSSSVGVRKNRNPSKTMTTYVECSHSNPGNRAKHNWSCHTTHTHPTNGPGKRFIPMLLFTPARIGCCANERTSPVSWCSSVQYERILVGQWFSNIGILEQGNLRARQKWNWNCGKLDALQMKYWKMPYTR